MSTGSVDLRFRREARGAAAVQDPWPPLARSLALRLARSLALRLAIVLAIVLVALAAGRAEAQQPGDLVIGSSKALIVAVVGEPDARETLVKGAEPIWGPEEAFWHEIPNGIRLERWIYQEEAGRYHLYFRAGQDGLAYKAFLPKGAVYEGSE